MFGGILREFWDILGKYRMLDVESVGSKGFIIRGDIKIQFLWPKFFT